MKFHKAILICILLSSSSAMAQVPSWSINPAEFQFSMSVHAQLYLDLEVEMTSGHLLGAFVNGQLRGVAVATEIDGALFYFLTVYSNLNSGEEIEFLVYLASVDSIFQAVEILDFERDANVGSTEDVYHINISLFGDFPIQISPVLADTTLSGIPFELINLSEHLITIDYDPVNWTVVSTALLNATIQQGQKLNVLPNNPLWLGTDSIFVIVTEQNTNLAFADTVAVYFTVNSNYFGPEFSFIHPQYADENNAFPRRDLDGNLIYDGQCLSYEVALLPMIGTIPVPVLTPPIPGTNPMNLIVELNYNNHPFTDQGILSGFVNSTLAGSIGNPVVVNDHVLYFLTLANVGVGKITFEFYDSGRKFLYTINTNHYLIPGSALGTLTNPLTLEMAPITIELLPDGEWTVATLDSSFAGAQIAEFRVADCEYPVKNDTIQVAFVMSDCQTLNILMCAGDAFCASTNPDTIEAYWFKDDIAISKGNVFSIIVPGTYYSYGITEDGRLILGCPITIEDGACGENFPATNYSEIQIDLPLTNGGTVIEPFTADLISFSVTWSGGSDNDTWHNPGNWIGGEVPNLCQHVVIPADMEVFLESNLSEEIWSLYAHPNAVLTIGVGAILKLVGK